jgi:hypothetical protein
LVWAYATAALPSPELFDEVAAAVVSRVGE